RSACRDSGKGVGMEAVRTADMNARHGIALDRNTLRFERLFPGSIERVWACLTEPGQRRKWLAGGEMELVVGGRVELFFLHNELTPHDEEIPERFCNMKQGHRMQGYITACEPPRLLAYTWGEDPQASSEVCFELTEQDGSVLLVLTHRRVMDADNMVGF